MLTGCPPQEPGFLIFVCLFVVSTTSVVQFDFMRFLLYCFVTAMLFQRFGKSQSKGGEQRRKLLSKKKKGFRSPIEQKGGM